MSVILNKQFESKFGFKSPNFTVDADGNIVATSITVVDAGEDINVLPANYTITQSSTSFSFAGDTTGINPSLIFIRGQQYIFDLNLTTISFSIYDNDQTSLYSSGLRHSDGTSNIDAQGNTTGRLAFQVPVTAADTIYYGDGETDTIKGTIAVSDPQGSFSNVTINATTASTDTLTGALTVAGGVGIEGNLNVGGDFTLQGVGIPKLISATSLELGAANEIIIKINNTSLGTIDGSGLNIAIGATTPSTAAFTTASVTSVGSANTSITNKTYVDTTATALAIAFGL